MVAQISNRTQNFNVAMFYAASTAVLAPVAGLASAVADLAAGIFISIKGGDNSKELASKRFSHILTDLACAIPGVATFGMFLLSMAAVVAGGELKDLVKNFA